MLYEKTTGEKIFDIVNYFILAFIGFVCLYPFIYVLCASFSDPILLYKGSPLLLFPRGFGTKSYSFVLKNDMLWTGYKNTIIYVGLGTILSLVLTIMGAYVLSRKRLPGRNAMAILITITMFVNGGMIPTYLVVRSMGFIDTIWAMLFPGAIQTYELIIMMSYFRSIHESMEESAKMDGANDFIILWRIFVPLAKPVIAVVGLYYIVLKWNSFFYPLLFLTKRELLPLQIVLREILIASEISSDAIRTSGGEGYQAYAETIRYGTIIVAILPIVMIYPFIQKYFVKGTMIGAIKE